MKAVVSVSMRSLCYGHDIKPSLVNNVNNKGMAVQLGYTFDE